MSKFKELKGLSKEVYRDYTGQTNKRTFKLKFRNKISKSSVYVSKKTGCVFHKPTFNTSGSLDVWEKQIFSNSIDTKKLKYSSNNPIMKARHYYAANFLINFIGKNKKSIRICDYGAGEGNFGLELIKLNNKIRYAYTEHSKQNFISTRKKIFSFYP